MGDLTNRNQGPQPINIFLESLTSATSFARELSDAEREVRVQKDEAILVLLGKLALVYWRPDFTPGQAKQLYSQYLDDLRVFAFKDIAEAVEKYRQDGENKFFPTPGQIREHITKVPDWDTSSRREHLSECHYRAQRELKNAAGDLKQLPSPKGGSQ